MSAIFFKSCPRCAGDLCVERDADGWYMTCLGCGCVTYVDGEIEAASAIRDNEIGIRERKSQLDS